MHTIMLNSRADREGFLHLKIPVSMTHADFKVTVILQPLPLAGTTATPEELGYSHGFFERTAGAWEGEPLIRGEQGEYEPREELW